VIVNQLITGFDIDESENVLCAGRKGEVWLVPSIFNLSEGKNKSPTKILSPSGLNVSEEFSINWRKGFSDQFSISNKTDTKTYLISRHKFPIYINTHIPSKKFQCNSKTIWNKSGETFWNFNGNQINHYKMSHAQEPILEIPVGCISVSP
jgi:hypothetical protein